ncbi:hypothetical protein SAMN05216419_10675 [Nitrosomonas cryotolerans]|uniref:Uncharacterized protein n=1 Tax=Nitrosomonas cryotolerans ATCC 49181 TaxID=1131553 RepID=A0A1N6G102_9PROT|nr:helix-hairpin-helix domain-containing protein [Nitrosomonas cryotolerans]SFQ11995.1 hypothetical protein SAMN05216419_10675 [Nitrosomonas cryotolerans]SIO01193.1 hypothetical protein SAMN02743940_0499 [Nitrosomonas cryotolerans ATCC 49181]
MTPESELKENHISPFYLSLIIVLSAIFVGVVGLLSYASLGIANATLSLHGQIAQWFDPVFFLYNLALLVFAVGIVPMVTLCYVHSMREEKKQRLKHELPHNVLNDNENKIYIDNYLKKAFTLRNYIGSMSTLMLVILFGCMIILLLKPMPLNEFGGSGVDYSKGANFLMLGTYMESYVLGKSSSDHIKILIYTLTAFQFGFLGAYVYFIGLLARSYFTLDMTPNLFISCSIRMMTGALLALVLCFIFVEPKFSGLDDILIKGLPVWSFMIGFFPSRGLALLENITTKILGKFLGWIRITEFASPLSDLPGINYDHEIRLKREGYDNIENLSNANALDLALHTGFGYKQLSQWISQAHLHGHLRNDYQTFVKCTGISSLHDFFKYWQAARTQNPTGDPAETLIAATGSQKNSLGNKINILCTLAEVYHPVDVNSDTPESPATTQTMGVNNKNQE